MAFNIMRNPELSNSYFCKLTESGIVSPRLFILLTFSFHAQAFFSDSLLGSSSERYDKLTGRTLDKPGYNLINTLKKA